MFLTPETRSVARHLVRRSVRLLLRCLCWCGRPSRRLLFAVTVVSCLPPSPQPTPLVPSVGTPPLRIRLWLPTRSYSRHPPPAAVTRTSLPVCRERRRSRTRVSVEIVKADVGCLVTQLVGLRVVSHRALLATKTSDDRRHLYRPPTPLPTVPSSSLLIFRSRPRTVVSGPGGVGSPVATVNPPRHEVPTGKTVFEGFRVTTVVPCGANPRQDQRHSERFWSLSRSGPPVSCFPFFYVSSFYS